VVIRIGWVGPPTAGRSGGDAIIRGSVVIMGRG
jgi:hypothetical protein